ncbi:SH3 domain-containing protein [Sphingobacterium sp. UT-1RO-CII-1]|uniref:SH3 domain-containing protein n=1 Tax=Sphingobacterium sp. UT-1RO-CII-1 TaxID=2995225 RepID=UPI00227BC2A4|nr:SH3 domain-containing protein [Sphingobacterium sp. UT-1RO-CII-1]MCY4779575.1 SH3 domain-containing protein [Sphingobacterium sp. UT-1RO-CII-1]
MTLYTKYKILQETAVALSIDKLIVEEVDGKLLIEGIAKSGEDKTKLWDLYSQLEPNFLADDLLLNVRVNPNELGRKAMLNTEEKNLRLYKGPGVNLPIVTTIGVDQVVNVLCKANADWWLLRTEEGEEGYCYVSKIDLVS